MSRTPFFFVEKLDWRTKKYELQHPWVWNFEHTERVPAVLFPYNGCHDLFSIVENKDVEDFPRMRGIHKGLPADVCEEIAEEYKKCSYDTEWGKESHHVEPNACWFTYADMYIYCMEHPEVVDYEAMDEAFYNGEKPQKKIMKPTPVKILADRVNAFLEVSDDLGWENDYSQIRIVYWIE